VPVQASNIIRTDSGEGLTFTADTQTWTVLDGVVIATGSGAAVFSGLYASTLANYGLLVSEGETAVRMDGDIALLVNDQSGDIQGAFTGVTLNGEFSDVYNEGSIVGASDYGVRFGENSYGSSLTNAGEIFGFYGGVRSEGTGLFLINNSGEISSRSHGVVIDSASRAVIFNSGAISAAAVGIGSFAVYAAEVGTIHLHNSGLLAGDVWLSGNADRLVNTGDIFGEAALGGGSDRFNGSVGFVEDVVLGQDGDDSLSGSVHADRMDGGRDLDLIKGEGGDDLLTGGLHSDRLLGGDGQDSLFGGADADRLQGGSNDDVIVGGGGDDRLWGGDGDDLFVFRGGFGADVVADFDAIGDDHDVIKFGREMFSSFDDLSAAMTQVGDHVLIQVEGGASVVLTDVALADLDSADFGFAA
jgi:Ca2+-binding RTX toxin-like protein